MLEAAHLPKRPGACPMGGAPAADAPSPPGLSRARGPGAAPRGRPDASAGGGCAPGAAQPETEGVALPGTRPGAPGPPPSPRLGLTRAHALCLPPGACAAALHARIWARARSYGRSHGVTRGRSCVICL